MTDYSQTSNNLPIKLLVTGHPAALRTTELAVCLAHRGRSVSVVLGPGADRIVPLAAWSSVESLLSGAVCPLNLSVSADGEELLVIAPAPLDLLGRLFSTDTTDEVVAAALAHRGPIVLAEPFGQAGADHELCVAVRTYLQEHGVRFAPIGSNGIPGMLPQPEQLAQWIVEAGCEAGVGQTVGNLPATEPVKQEGDSSLESSKKSPDSFWPNLPETVVLAMDGPLTGKRLLITGGPTREILDPVHTMTTGGNGHLAWWLAVEALSAGARVCLVLGPVAFCPPKVEGLVVHPVQTAEEMLRVTREQMGVMDGIILADDACVLRSEKPFGVPVLRTGNSVALRVVETPDLAQAVAFEAQPRQWVSQIQVAPLPEGFSAEVFLQRRRLTAFAWLEAGGNRPARMEPLGPGQALEDRYLIQGGAVQLVRRGRRDSLVTGNVRQLLLGLVG